MKIDPHEHYNEDYFYTPGVPGYKQKTYRKVTVEEYIGPGDRWHGFEFVLDFLLAALPAKPVTMMDLACGSGDFVARAASRGINSMGVDISQYSIAHPRYDDEEGLSAVGRLYWRDLTGEGALEEFGKFDLVTGLDLLEHIYLEDLDSFEKNLHDVAGGYVFWDVCTARKSDDRFTHVQGEEVPITKEWIAVAGHVHVISWEEWISYFQSKGWKIEWEVMGKFNAQTAVHPDMSKVVAWSPANIIVMSLP